MTMKTTIWVNHKKNTAPSHLQLGWQLGVLTRVPGIEHDPNTRLAHWVSWKSLALPVGNFYTEWLTIIVWPTSLVVCKLSDVLLQPCIDFTSHFTQELYGVIIIYHDLSYVNIYNTSPKPAQLLIFQRSLPCNGSFQEVNLLHPGQA